MKIINNYENPNSKKFNSKSVIAELEAMLKPVLKALTSLPVPSIPGLAQIADLLASLKSFVSSDDSGGEEAPQAEIPPELTAKLKDLLAAIQSLCTTLPLVLVNLIF